MLSNLVWSVVIPMFSAIMAVVLWLEVGSDQPDLTIGAVGLLLIVVGWFVIGRLGTGWSTAGSDGMRTKAAAVAYTAVIVLGAGLTTAAAPSLAIVQCIAYPLVWVLAADLRGAVIANVALGTSVGIGFYTSLGGGADALLQTVVTIFLSLLLSFGMGIWISRIAALGEERRLLLETLEAAQGELAAAHRDAGIHEERARLAREIHDTLAQDLTGIVLLAQGAGRDLAAGDAEAAATRIRHIEEGARRTLGEARVLVAASAGGLDEGLDAAVRRLGERFGREASIAVTVTASASPDLDRAEEVVLLRCAQESLANVRKHAGATTASVRLDGRELSVTDDGEGFDVTDPAPGFGLTGMRERLALMGGSLHVVSSPAGTTVTARLPEHAGIAAAEVTA